MMEAKIIDRKSWLVWLNRVFLAVAVTMIISIARGSATMALSNVGPSSPGDRYNLTKHSTHPYTELEVPVYFKDKPDSDVGVKVFDIHRSPGDWSSGAVFNGGARIHGDGHFTVNAGDFWYDSSTGYWKARIRASLIGSLFQFKLQLDRSDGIIAYATGRASQASIRYNDRMGDIIGHERKEMQMALPCSFTEPTHLGGPGSPYHLRLYDLDTWYPWWGTNNGKQPLSVSVLDETTGETVAYYDGNDPEYQCGQLGAGDDGVYGDHGCMGENGVLYVEMTMYPDHKYKIIIDNVWKNNLIEYELPFDNIFYNISCEPKVDMRTTVDFTKSVNKGRFKQLSSYGKYNSNEGKGNGNNSIAEVMGYPGKYHFKKWEGISPQDSGLLPKAIMDSDELQGHGGELYPGDVLTWWFRAYNSGGYIVPDAMKMDFANLREGWIDPRLPGESWNQPEPKPEKGSNWFWPADRGGPLNGSDHRQVMWGCYGWGKECTDYSKGFNGSDPNHGVSISKQEAVEKHYRYIVKSGDAGQTLCQWLRMSWNYNGWKQRLTPKACVYIPYHYPPPDDKDKHSGVVPTARVADGYKSKVQAGDDVQFSYSLTNTSGSGSTVSRQIEYRSYTFILRRGAKLPQNSEQKPYHYAKRWDGNGVGCGGRDIIPGTQGRCEQGVGGTSEKIYPGQTWPVLGQPKYNVSGIWLAQPGDKICSYIAVDNNWSVTNDKSADTFRASNIACVVVTKSPNLNLSGSDSYADKGFQGASVSKSDKVPGTDKRGSYSQYGLLTGDTKVTNFGSAGYTTADSNYHHLACKLSYANTDSAQGNCNDLKWLKPAGLPKKSLSMPSSTNTTPLPGGSNVDLGGLQSGNYKAGSGSLKIHGDLGKGTHITIFAEQADVTITGKIDADVGPYTKLSDIPSFTIMAKNIKVNPGVSLITGTYVAKDHFESCNNGAQEKGPTLGVEGVCQNKLKVNGAIVSDNSPVFRRTFGAGNESEDYQWDTNRISSTAEWINYTPNLWLTTSNGSSGNQLEGLTTTQVTNLPVRY